MVLSNLDYDSGREGDQPSDGYGNKTAVLLIRHDPGSIDHQDKVDEFRGLAEAAGYRILSEIVQSKGRNTKFQLGRGKIAQALDLDPDKLIFYHPLSPGQVASILQEFGVRAIDKFNLILEIFASRAATREAKLQVELARLTYESPFVRNMVSSRKFTERPGFRSLGTYEDSMYQDMKRRMAKIRETLKNVEGMGEERRQHRRELGFDLVALAGYTNSGKTTLLNSLTGSNLEAKDQLFTTLSPITRALNACGRKVVLTDTVGFIDDLPHFLIQAFRSTLFEISYADLVLLVADVSDDPRVLHKKLAASHKVLWECKTSCPIITVLNKSDKISEEELEARLSVIKGLAPNPTSVSALKGDGLDELKRAIPEMLYPIREREISLSYDSQSQRALSRLYDHASEVQVSYGDKMIVRFQAKELKRGI